jgi:hypothetical protein
MTRNLRLTLAFVLALAACRDAAAPSGLTARRERLPRPPETFTAAAHVLQQSSTAPALENHVRSFWLYKGREATIRVNYQPAGGQLVGQPFLRFNVPKQSLEAGGGGAPLKPGDSVLVTLTIDPLEFSVGFEPSGVQFSSQFPAELAFWYANANLDLTGDGVVDGADAAGMQQIALWYKGRSWSKLTSLNDIQQRYVQGELGHFSEYAVSW